MLNDVLALTAFNEHDTTCVQLVPSYIRYSLSSADKPAACQKVRSKEHAIAAMRWKQKTKMPGATEKTSKRESSADRQRRMYESIRARISTLRYPPGMMLNETVLAEEFGVSRTPLRRVLQRLSHEGLLEIRNGVGTIVTDIDIKTFKEIYDLRVLLAEAMGSLSPRRIQARHTQKMAELIAQAEEMRAEQDVAAYASLCNELQTLLVDLIGSEPLREMTDVLYYRSARIWYVFLPNLDWPSTVDALLRELSCIKDAMTRGDIAEVGRVRGEYFRWTLQNVGKYISSA